MDEPTMRARVDAARVARLATVTPAGDPHVVPVCVATVGEVLGIAVDDKPKRSRALRRLDNVRAGGAASLLVDAYDEDWTRLWWVRVDADARVVESGAEVDAVLAALHAKYRQYEEYEPSAPVLVLEPRRWSGWAATDDA